MDMIKLVAVNGFHHNRKAIDAGESFEATPVDADYLVRSGAAKKAEEVEQPQQPAQSTSSNKRSGNYNRRDVAATPRNTAMRAAAAAPAAAPAEPPQPAFTPESFVMTTQTDPALVDAPPAVEPTLTPPAEEPAAEPAATQPSSSNRSGNRGRRAGQSTELPGAGMTPEQEAFVTSAPPEGSAE